MGRRVMTVLDHVRKFYFKGNIYIYDRICRSKAFCVVIIQVGLSSSIF